jgi:hypothetical protein
VVVAAKSSCISTSPPASLVVSGGSSGRERFKVGVGTADIVAKLVWGLGAEDEKDGVEERGRALRACAG